jgi:membrane protein DedA with SNARE-associated domain
LLQFLLSLRDAWQLPLVIIGGTLVHEDLTTVATGVLVADRVMSARVALPSLYAGIVIGDIGLYGLGRLLALRAARYGLSTGERYAAIKRWLDRHVIAGVFTVRFMPGLRLSAYTAYGFFAMPFGRFVISVLLAASVWTTGLFYLSCLFGLRAEAWLGYWKWPTILLGFLVPLALAGRLMRGRLSPEPTPLPITLERHEAEPRRAVGKPRQGDDCNCA